MTDAKVGAAILKLKLDGVMTHVALYEQFNKYDIHGMAAMHRYHAEEEFHCYLMLLKKYMKIFKKAPEMGQIVPSIIELDGATREEIIKRGMDVYELWEKSVLDKLREQMKTDDCEEIKELVDEVKVEIGYIRMMQNDLDEGKWEQLNIWATKKWKD